MRATVDINIGCGHCYYCRRNEILNCREMQQIGISRDGGLAEYVAVPARLALPAPSAMVLCEYSMNGSVAGMGEDMYDAMTLLLHERFRLDAFTAVSRPLADVQDVFESLAADPAVLKTQIVI